MKRLGLRSIRSLARGAKDRLRSKALVLLYHRVRPDPCFDPYVLGVSPDHFAEHLEIIPKYGRPMGLRQLAKALRNGKLPHRSVVITFDDGYVDNLQHARPLLERYDFPATVFVASGYVGQTREFWWEDLARLLLHPGTFSEVLQLRIGEEQHRWELGKAASYSRQDHDRDRKWNYASDTEPTARHTVFRALYRKLSRLSHSERSEVLEALRSQVALDEPSATHRVLTPAEVVRLAEGGLVEIGAHTVNHPVLASLPLADQREEVEGSKSRLEEIVGRPVTSFAYPYGSRARSDYTLDTVAIVRDAGFSCACSNLAQTVRGGADLFQISRAGTRDWDGESLARRLETWFRT